MSSISKSIGKVTGGARGGAAKEGSSLVVSIEEIRRLLGVGRATAYGVARKLGRRVGRRGRLIVSRHALEAWLHGEAAR
jgi:hypothetical protein